MGWTARDVYPENPLRVVSRHWRHMQSQVFFLVILSNAVLSYWYLAWDLPLMLSYLWIEGINLWWLATFRSAIAIVSLIMALISPFIDRMGKVLALRMSTISTGGL